MQSIQYGFDTNLRRSGHAACYCPPLGAIVQFGGWPPSAELSLVIRREGSQCPLYIMPLTEVLRGMRRAEAQEHHTQRYQVPSFFSRRHMRRLHKLRLLSSEGTAALPAADASSLPPSPSEEEEEGHAACVADTDSEAAVDRRHYYDEGYHSAPPSTPSSSSSSTSSSSPAAADAEVQQDPSGEPDAGGDREEGALHDGDRPPVAPLRAELLPGLPQSEAASVTPRSTAAPSLFDDTYSTHHLQEEDRVTTSLRDTAPIKGKRNTRPLRWEPIVHSVAPRTRHGHHLLYHGHRLYVVGGCYWAHGDALATTDMYYCLRGRAWHQMESLMPPRFCAAVTWSSSECAAAETEGAADDSARSSSVLYAFGGLDFTRRLSNTLYRVWLPSAALEELPQYGAAPRPQFKGLLVADVQREVTPAARKAGQQALGALYYMDGFVDGRPMAPALRRYDLATGVWTRLCTCPDLVRSQISFRSYVASSSDSGTPSTRLARFDVCSGMPARRGRQRRSRLSYSYNVATNQFDYVYISPAPGLTAHTCVSLPPLPTSVAADLSPEEQEGERILQVLQRQHHIHTICCGGNEDLDEQEQNTLGEPVGWLYLYGTRDISLRESVKLVMERNRFSLKLMTMEKDSLLDELF